MHVEQQDVSSAHSELIGIAYKGHSQCIQQCIKIKENRHKRRRTQRSKFDSRYAFDARHSLRNSVAVHVDVEYSHLRRRKNERKKERRKEEKQTTRMGVQKTVDSIR
jgi:hypothetical protein